MYNYHIHLRSLQQEEQELSTLDSTAKGTVDHSKINRSLLGKYQKRLERIIKDAHDSETAINTFRHGICNITRSNNKAKNIGPELVINSQRSHHQRIRRRVQENSCIDTIPQDKSPSTHKFRDRAKSREIQPSMRFTCHLPMQRVTQNIRRGNLTTLDPLDESGFLKQQKSILERSSFMPRLIRKKFVSSEFSRHVFQNLHKKTYFKTLEHTAVAIPGHQNYSEIDTAGVLPQQKDIGGNQKVNTKQSPGEQLDLPKLCKQALIKSKVIESRQRQRSPQDENY